MARPEVDVGVHRGLAAVGLVVVHPVAVVDLAVAVVAVVADPAAVAAVSDSTPPALARTPSSVATHPSPVQAHARASARPALHSMGGDRSSQVEPVQAWSQREVAAHYQPHRVSTMRERGGP
jgi:hypothetical protein